MLLANLISYVQYIILCTSSIYTKIIKYDYVFLYGQTKQNTWSSLLREPSSSEMVSHQNWSSGHRLGQCKMAAEIWQNCCQLLQYACPYWLNCATIIAIEGCRVIWKLPAMVHPVAILKNPIQFSVFPYLNGWFPQNFTFISFTSSCTIPFSIRQIFEKAIVSLKRSIQCKYNIVNRVITWREIIYNGMAHNWVRG